jgi:hypothetical protein
MHQRRGTPLADHLKLVLSIIDRQVLLVEVPGSPPALPVHAAARNVPTAYFLLSADAGGQSREEDGGVDEEQRPLWYSRSPQWPTKFHDAI